MRYENERPVIREVLLFFECRVVEVLEGIKRRRKQNVRKVIVKYSII